MNNNVEHVNNNMTVYSASLKGLREQNEDAHVSIINLDSKNPAINNVNLYGVFDGHGGKEVSKFVKDYLPKFFVDKRIEYPISKKYVVTVYDHIQKTLHNHSFAYYSGSTGLIVINFKYNNENYINVINNGDSRCVICRDNFAMPLSKDHKPSWPEEYHRITGLGGKIVIDNYGDHRIKDLSVSRAFGDIDAAPFVTHRPDLFRYKIDKCDKFLIMACDGLWDVLSSEEAINFVLSSCYDVALKNRIHTKENIAKKLAMHALKKGSTDNISLYVIFFN